MTALFQGVQLNLAACIQMEMFTMHRGRVYISHHGFHLFPFPNPTLISVSDPSNWVFDNDIDQVLEMRRPQPLVGKFGGGGGNVSPSGASFEGGSNLLSSFGVVPFEEEEYTLPLTLAYTSVGSLGFDATHCHRYMDDHFSNLNLRLDAFDEWQQQHAQE